MKPNRVQFEKLALEHLDTLYRVANRLTRNPAAAEDLVQETYLRALRGADGFHLESFGIRPWLLRILHNLHNSRAQRESRQPKAIDGEQLAALPEPDHQQSQTVAALLDSVDGPLAAALDELPHDYQQVMLLWAVEDLSYKEIAAALDIPIGTVMSRLHRARQRLFGRLHDYAQKQRLIRE